MKFAIRKIAITCVLPTALWQGPMMSDAWAQNFPTASSKLNAGMPQHRAVPPKKRSPAQPQPPAVNSQPQYPAAARRADATPAPIYQVANPGGQQPAGNGGGETDVQRQLRLLYEKSGQEMPAMDLNELEVPEPQPGVAPGSGGADDSEEGESQPQSRPQYAQPSVPAPQKAPNFFERVFLGKKTPRPAPAPQPRPQFAPQGQVRPGQPNGTPNGTPPNNYRPYQPATSQQPGQPGQVQPQMNTQTNNGQRANPAGQPAATAQPNVVPQQQVPQLQLQRPPGQVIPAPLPNTTGQNQQQQTPQRLAEPQQIKTPPQYNPQGAGNAAQNPAGRDDVPFLDDEPEESMEFDLSPNAQKPQGNVAPAETPPAVAPIQVPTSNAISNPAVNSDQVVPPKGSDTPAADANPFSGLRLSIPESAVPAAAPIATPANPTITPATSGASTSAAANAVLAPNHKPKPAPASSLPERDPFAFDDDEPAATVAKPKELPALPAVKVVSPATNKPAEVTPEKVADKAEKPINKATDKVADKVAAPVAKPAGAVAAKPASRSSSDERLKKLAEASEKTGLKGFCPVALRQKGELIETKLQFNSTYQGKKYYFSSVAAKAAFEATPHLFAPVHDGLDGVALTDDDKSLPGSLDHAVWYQGGLYLFANRENRDTFVNDPEGYLDDIELEQTLTKAVSNPAKPATPVPQQKAPTTVPSDIQIKPATQTVRKPAQLPEDLPVLSDDLGDLPKLTPVTSNAPEPIANQPAARTPALAPTDGVKPESTTRDAAAPAAPKPAVQPSATSPGSYPGSGPDSNLMKKATRNTPASFSVPAQPAPPRRAVPRLISPDLRLAPAVSR